MRSKGRFLDNSPYFYAMLYAKLFHGYDILKHGSLLMSTTHHCSMSFTRKRCFPSSIVCCKSSTSH